MIVTGVTDYAILTILRCRLGLRVLLLLQVSLTAPAFAFICSLGLLDNPRSLLLRRRRGGGVVSGPFGRSFWGIASEIYRFVGTRRGDGRYCRWGTVRLCSCK